MRITLDADRSAYQLGRIPDGYSADRGPELTIEQDEDGYGVRLMLDPHPAETLDDRQIDRTLTPAEARELAAALWHHADTADRRIGLR